MTVHPLSLTKQEAIEILSECCDKHSFLAAPDFYEAVYMAREALIAQIVSEEVKP